VVEILQQLPPDKRPHSPGFNSVDVGGGGYHSTLTGVNLAQGTADLLDSNMRRYLGVNEPLLKVGERRTAVVYLQSPPRLAAGFPRPH